MKKNIIIIGTGRAGKTTLAKKLNEELHFSVIGTDDLIGSFERSFPQLGIGYHNDIEKMVANLTPFLAHFLGILSYRTNCRNGTHYVVEGSGTHFDFEKLITIWKQHEEKEDEWKDQFLLIGLIYPNLAAERLISDIRKHDTEDDWSYNLSDDELRSMAAHCIEYSKEFNEKYKKYDPIIYDVSENREDVLNKIVDDIKVKLNM